jgi:uncharacterized circularly permuted ATP-grasp superfamily protein
MTTAAPLSLEVRSDLLTAYRQHAVEGYDELLDASGAIRPHWKSLLQGLGGLSDGDREMRAARLARRVKETGIAYDIFADPNAAPQRWTLDLAPIVISAGEWQWLEAALIQRARLFDALLNDIYGMLALPFQ